MRSCSSARSPDRGRSGRARYAASAAGDRRGLHDRVDLREHDDVPERLAPLHRDDRLVDPLERVAGGDELVELEAALAVARHQARHVHAEPGRAHVAAEEPEPVAGEVPDRDRRGGAGRRHAHQHDRPAAPDERERLAHRRRAAHRHEDVVGAPAAGQLPHEPAARHPGVRRRRGSPRSAARPGSFRGTTSTATMGEAPASRAPWIAFTPTPPAPMTTALLPGRELGRVEDGPDPGDDAAGEEARPVEAEVGRHRHQLRLVHDHGLREARDADPRVERLAGPARGGGAPSSERRSPRRDRPRRSGRGRSGRTCGGARRPRGRPGGRA